MPTNGRKKKKKRVGSTHASGKTALSFKKGTPNYTETPVNTKGVLRHKRSVQKKKVPLSQQTRDTRETYAEFKKRRDKYRRSLKK